MNSGGKRATTALKTKLNGITNSWERATTELKSVRNERMNSR
jgi:hypothetical protein